MRRLLVLASVVMFGLAFPFVLAWYESSPRFWPNEKFERARWKASPPEQRFMYFKSLKATQKLVGSTKDEVVALLGPPDNVAPDNKYIAYILKSGEHDRFTLNFVYFVRIWLDPHGTVEEVQVAAD